ncbi:TPA: recombinase family protein [Vibrio parahaemolyticus]|uniref:recombinase family protein n=1 Tax=Vibrio parahaemolyticus TaxID=670 RepID=UPI000A35F34D|nr:recombinase family protein [Vibrio parahaemolyticus]EHP3974647.1 recombinase family protein [Vibrio parahaemolyticus]MBM4935533.1 recombinase family protein [Vibrio parahaemolyticus]OUJ47817.1 resolvase [Vibrio parahaemolyticus]
MIRAYLRASTNEQGSSRAKQELREFVKSKNLQIASFYQENISGTAAERPELDRLIEDSEDGDVLLIEKMNRLTRLPFQVWETLKGRIKAKGISIVVLDQPMTHQSISNADVSVSAIQQALTNFMLDLGAAMARDDYETRQKRAQQGIAKAKREGRYKGRPVNAETAQKCRTVHLLVSDGETVSAACKAQGVGRATYYKYLSAQG